MHVIDGAFSIENSVPSVNSVPNKSNNYSIYPTIFDAIKTSEGFTRNADITKIQLVRKNSISNGGGKIKTELNFENFLKGDMSQNLRIYDGDSIIVNRSNNDNSKTIEVALKTNVNPKFIEVFVQGSVLAPGKIQLPSQSSLNQAILFAGGTQVINGPITHITFLPDGTYKSKKIKYKKRASAGSSSNPFLSSKDIIFVQKGNIATSSAFINIITTPLTNLMSTYGLYKAITE